MTITELIDSSLWWEGPPWLRDSPDHWPSQPEALSGRVPEVKNLVLTLHSEPSDEFLLRRYSRYILTLSVIAWIYRFFNNTRTPPPKHRTEIHLIPDEIHEAETRLVKLHQAHHFSKELNDLKKNSSVSSTVLYIAFNPF